MKKSILFLFIMSSFAAMAQETQNDRDTLRMYNLKEAVVSATKTPRQILEIPMRIYAVPVTAIKSGSFFTIDDVLKSISGVSVSRSMGFLDRRATVSMRGMGHEQGRTLVLLNGMPINKASTGSVNFNMINLGNVERIEVVKGPGSSMYGGNAMGGTINFITREPQRKFEGNVSTDYGMFNTVGTNANIGARGQKVYANLNAFARTSTGYNGVPEEERTAQNIKIALKEAGVGGLIGFYLNPTHKIEFSTTFYTNDRSRGDRFFGMNENGGVGYVLDADVTQKSGTYKLTYQGTNELFSWNTTAFLSTENYTEGRFRSTTELYDVTSKRRDWGVWFNQSYSGFSHQTITAGLEYKGGFVDGRDVYRTSTDVIINKGESNAFALYLQDEIRPGSGRFSLIPALRFDYARFGNGGFYVEGATSISDYLVNHGATGSLPNEGWTSLNPRLAFQYRIGEMSRMYANIGTGFRPGALEDMCRTGPISGGVVVANPELKPEKLTNYEVGADFTLVRGLVLSPSFYYTLGRDFVYAVNTGETILMNNRQRPLLKQSNIGKVKITGFEIDLNYTLTGNLALFANYTQVNSKIKEFFDPNNPDKNIDGKYLTYVPRFEAAAGGTLRTCLVNLNLLYRHLGKQYTTDDNNDDNTIAEYGQFDAKIWRSFAHGVSLTIGVNNLFDKQVKDSNGNLMMGRYLYTKISVSF